MEEISMENENKLDMGDLLERRIMENFSGDEREEPGISDERLKEMNKRLPEWSLEPPFSFLN